MGKRVRPLCRETYSEKSLTMPKIAAFDFETKGLGGEYIIGAIVTSDAHRLLFDNLDGVFDWIISHPEYRYLAHNAVGYEFAYLYPLVYRHFATSDTVELVPTIQGDTRIIQLRIISKEPEGRQSAKSAKSATKRVVDIRDTLCLFGMALEKVADAFCPELPKLKENIDFEKENFDPSNPDHIDYVFRDCDIVLLAYQRLFQSTVEVFGSPLGVTAGSSALKAFKSTIPEGHVYYRTNKEAEGFIRKCYYGGLVLPGRNIGNWGATGSVDVNGAYAYQMATHEFPVGSATGTHKYVPGYIGFYHVIACVPGSVFETLGFNPVPRRDKAGLVWPTGTFDTYLTSPEIEYAQTRGCTIDVLCGYIFTRKENVFKPFIDKCQAMEIANDGCWKPTIKIYRNAAYGKFGAKEEHGAVLFSRTQPEGYYPLTREDTGEIIDGIWVGQEISDAEYMLPHWAALITAYERLYLMQFIEEAYRRGATNVYTDTDSMKCDLSILLDMIKDKFIPIGIYYGQFKLEDICKEFKLLGGKCFLGELAEPNKKGEIYVIKAKGVPTRTIKKYGADTVYADAVEALKKPNKGKKAKLLDAQRQMEFESVISVMNIIKENSCVRPVPRKRKITDIRNSYSWQLVGDKIYPHGYEVLYEKT